MMKLGVYEKHHNLCVTTSCGTAIADKPRCLKANAIQRSQPSQRHNANSLTLMPEGTKGEYNSSHRSDSAGLSREDTGLSRGMSPCPQLCRSLNEWMHAVNSTSLAPHPQLSVSPHSPQSLPLPFQNISLGFVCLTGIGGSCQYVLVVTFYEHVCLLTESSKSQNILARFSQSYEETLFQ